LGNIESETGNRDSNVGFVAVENEMEAEEKRVGGERGRERKSNRRFCSFNL
jgi:hypothetical protein